LPCFADERCLPRTSSLTKLGRTPDQAKKAELLQTFAAPDRLATETSVWDDTNWDEGQWPADDGLYEKLLQRIRELDKKDKLLKQSRDSRIAETTIKCGLTLVTDDKNLSQTTVEHSGQVMTLEQFSALHAPAPSGS